MADTRLVSALLLDLRKRTDTLNMEERHTDTELMHELSQSLRACLNELIRAGYTEHLTWGAVAALPAAPPTDESYLAVAFPAGLEIFGVDVHNGTRWYSLEKIQVEDRRRFENRQGQLPAAWLVQNLPRTGTAATITPGVIQVYPASTRALNYRLIYLEPHPELTATTQVVYGFDGDWLEWAIWDAAIKVLFTDDESDPTQDAKAVRERGIIGARMGVNITRVSRGPILPTRAGSGGISRNARG